MVYSNQNLKKKQRQMAQISGSQISTNLGETRNALLKRRASPRSPRASESAVGRQGLGICIFLEHHFPNPLPKGVGFRWSQVLSLRNWSENTIY